MNAIKSAAKALGVNTTALYQALSARSIDAAIAEQGLGPLVDRLRTILPSIRDQYTDGFIDSEYDRYWERKMRGLHAFQLQCLLAVVEHLNRENLVVADIGDSSGNHAAYLKALTRPGQVDRVISVNLDPVAVDKVRAKGGDSLLCRAEEMDLEGLRPDLFVSFEMVEHLTDPLRFFHSLASRGQAEYLLFTVPLQAHSRVGGYEMRQPVEVLPQALTPEQVHIFEFSPDDWQRLAFFGGFQTLWSRTYRQYPLYSPLRVTAPLWRKLDLEGFVAFFCRRDLSLAQRYTGW